MTSTSSPVDNVQWSKYLRALDGGRNTDAVVQQICADNGLDAAANRPLVVAVLNALAKAAPRGDEYVAPAVVQQQVSTAAQRHCERSAVVSPVVRAALDQRLLHDESPLINLFDWDAYTQRLENLCGAFPEPVFTHALAVKANPMRGILREAQRRGLGAECASFAEAKHALSLGVPPRKVIYDSPCKTEGELREMLRAGVYVNLDNEEEIEKVSRVLDGGDAPEAQIGLRINPVVGGGSIDALSTATASSKFGVPWTHDTTERLVALFERHPWLQGVHVHVGSQGCPIDLLVAGAKRSVEFAQLVNRRVGRQQIKVLDIGGGMPTVYDGGVKEAHDFHDYAKALRLQVPELFTSGFTSIITEFGRSIFVKPGLTVSKVEALKDWAGQRIAVIHVGADQFPRTAYLPHLWSHCITVLDHQGGVKSSDPSAFKRHDVAGPLCFSGDIMAKQVLLPSIETGDMLVIHDSGGYTFSMFSKYNSRPAAAYYAYRRTSSGVEFVKLKDRESPEETLAFWGIDTTVQF
ncbi:hypothetical protein ATCC90586_004204 [Pythium insidiosum]|nr:hypothetical protein ATCC90586_004204 [Pythium insidiosum]